MNLFEIGKEGQDLVLQAYLDRGYSIVTTNFEYRRIGQQGRLGEIDLVFYKEKVVYFVEVKTRNNSKYGSALEQITRKKLQTLYRAILYFLSKKEFSIYRDFKSQFDAAIVEKGAVKVYPNCYTFDGM